MFKAVERIETVYFTPNVTAFMQDPMDYLMSSQQLGGGIFYISPEEVVQDHFKNHPERDCLLLQYNIPSDQQFIISKLYQEQKGVAGFVSSFCASADLRPKDILNVDYYAGYWEYSKKDGTISREFRPCDVQLKKAMADKMRLQMISKSLPKLNKKISDNEKVLGLNTLLFGFTYFLPKDIAMIWGAGAFITLVLLLKMELNLRNERNDLKEKQNKIALEDPEFCAGTSLNPGF